MSLSVIAGAHDPGVLIVSVVGDGVGLDRFGGDGAARKSDDGQQDDQEDFHRVASVMDAPTKNTPNDMNRSVLVPLITPLADPKNATRRNVIPIVLRTPST